MTRLSAIARTATDVGNMLIVWTVLLCMWYAVGRCRHEGFGWFWDALLGSAQ